MIKFLEDRLKEQREKLKSHIIDRGNAGPESVGSYENLIQNTSAEIKRLEKNISIQKKASTPENINIYCVVLVSTIDKIKNNLEATCHCHLEDDRYHQTDCSQWKPYQNKDCIAKILEEYKKRYPIEISYLDGELSDNQHLIIDDNIEQTIAIVDLFSLNESNKNTALKFDTKKTAGLITPLCRTLHKDLCTHAEKMCTQFRTINARINSSLPNSFFLDVAGLSSFNRHFSTILTTKFPIKNQSTVSSEIRSLNLAIS